MKTMNMNTGGKRIGDDSHTNYSSIVFFPIKQQ
jgi:hypothetical protein